METHDIQCIIHSCAEWNSFHIELTILMLNRICHLIHLHYVRKITFKQRLNTNCKCQRTANLFFSEIKYWYCSPVQFSYLGGDHQETWTGTLLRLLFMRSLNGNRTSSQTEYIQSTKTIMWFSEYEIRIENNKSPGNKEI